MDEFLRTIYYSNLTPTHISAPFDNSVKLNTAPIIKDGDGSGDGSGYGNGSGDGSGSGYGDGDGDGNGSGGG